jgi:hypothetical protein
MIEQASFRWWVSSTGLADAFSRHHEMGNGRRCEADGVVPVLVTAGGCWAGRLLGVQMFISVAKFSVRQNDSEVILHGLPKPRKAQDNQLKPNVWTWRGPWPLLCVPDRHHIN